MIVTTPAGGAHACVGSGCRATVEVIASRTAIGSTRVRSWSVLRRSRRSTRRLRGRTEPLGGLVDAGLVDELFLTVAPQLAGRSPATPAWASSRRRVRGR